MAASLSSLMLPPSALRASPRNARRHPPEQVSQLAASIRAHGFGAPIIADESDEILAGHGRLLAAIEAGLDLVPVILVSGLTPDEADAFRLLDNRLGEMSSWDDAALQLELSELRGLISPDDLAELMGSITLSASLDDIRALLPLTSADLSRFLSGARSDLAADLSGGHDAPPSSLMDAVDTSAANAILQDPALRECSPEVQRVLRAAASQLIRFDYAAIRAYYNAAPAGSAIRAALSRHRDVVPVSAPERAAWLKLFDAMADALRADFAAADSI